MHLLFLSLKRSVQIYHKSLFELAVITAIAIGAIFTGLFAGVAVILYFWLLNSRLQAHHVSLLQQRLQLLLQFQGVHRLRTMTKLGVALWVALWMMTSPGGETVFGFPVIWVLLQPLFLAMMLANQYDLPAMIALRSMVFFIWREPACALPIMGATLLGFCGVWCGSLFDDAGPLAIMVLATLPIAFLTALQLLEAAKERLVYIIQEAYS